MIIMLRVFTSFSGYDSQCLALNRLPIDYELVGWSEIDAYANKAHNALFPQWSDRNYGDISKIDWQTVPDFDLFTYSSPCQDFSAAGVQRGGEKGSGTRSSLLWECERAIEAKKPKYLLMENVSALVSDKFIKTFNEWQLTLDRLGYKSWAKVLDAQDYGVPQHRERIFLVSILDIERKFEFPKPIKLEKRLKDVLESNVPEKYYLSEKTIESYENITRRHAEKGNTFAYKPKTSDEIAGTITTRNGSRQTDNYIKEPQVLAPKRNDYAKAIRKDYEAGKVKDKLSNLHQYEPREDGVSNTITSFLKDNYVAEHNYRIRKLTPRECFRLMDVDDADIDKLLEAKIPNTQLYKLAGNSIVVAVLERIFDKMFVNTEITNWTLF